LDAIYISLFIELYISRPVMSSYDVKLRNNNKVSFNFSNHQ